jgi:hypothetical protein
VGKRGCPWGLCKRCCNKKESTDSQAATASSTAADDITGTMRSTSNILCNVHKSSAKELEKMAKKQKEKKRFLEGHNPCEEQASMTVSEEKSDEVESSALEAFVSPEAAPWSSETAYTTSCRALLIGIGADEQMVGAVCIVTCAIFHLNVSVDACEERCFASLFASSSSLSTQHLIRLHN